MRKSEISRCRFVRHGVPHNVPGHRRRQAYDDVPGPQHRRDADRARREVPPRRPGAGGAHPDAEDTLRPCEHGFGYHIPLPPGPLLRCGMRHRGDDPRRMEEKGQPVWVADRDGRLRRPRPVHLGLPPQAPDQMRDVQGWGRPGRRRDEGRHLQGPPQRPHQRRVRVPHGPREGVVRERHVLLRGYREAVHREQGAHPSRDHPSREPDRLPHLHRRRGSVQRDSEAGALRLRPSGRRADKGGAREGGGVCRGADGSPHHRGPRQDGPRRRRRAGGLRRPVLRRRLDPSVLGAIVGRLSS